MAFSLKPYALRVLVCFEQSIRTLKDKPISRWKVSYHVFLKKENYVFFLFFFCLFFAKKELVDSFLALL